MSDLNDWRLDYSGTSFTFGTLSTGYPLEGQVEIGDPDRSIQDQEHPTSDGMVFGTDKLGGFTITFDCRIVPIFPPPAKPWDNALNLFSTFKSKWRADSIRRVAGSYATLSNLDRGRLVYGRPRKATQKLERLRKGLLDFVATFDTVDPNFYGLTEKSATIEAGVPASPGFTMPITPPFSTGSNDEVILSGLPVQNDGDLATWPRIEFHGPGSNFSLSLLSGASTIWTVQVPGGLKFDEILTVDTRPWSRSATINGRPANGRIRGTQIEKVTVPPGSYDLMFIVTDPSGTASAVIRWRDAYASL